MGDESTILGEIGLLRTTLKRVGSHMINTENEIKSLHMKLDKNNIALYGEKGEAGILLTIEKLLRYGAALDKFEVRDKELEIKLGEITKYKKWLKVIIWPGIVFALSNIGVLVWNIIKFAISKGWHPFGP